MNEHPFAYSKYTDNEIENYKQIIMATTIYSHAFLVGSFNGELKPEQLDTKSWKLIKITQDEYKDRISDYYQSLIDSMVEADTKEQQRPAFLNDVHHYIHSFMTIDEECKKETGKSVTIGLTKGKNKIPFNYTFQLCNLHLYFFPLNIVLVAIEFDDSDNDLDNLTAAHHSLVNWKYKDFSNESIDSALTPLGLLLESKDISKLVKDSNNLKIFQIVQTTDAEPANDLLFEIATFSPIGAVKGKKKQGLTPSDDYYNHILSENSVSAFYSWRALALVDSFTVLAGKNDFSIWPQINHYFPLIYLRCIFEKTYCFSRNNAYRMNNSAKNLSEELSDMEKYYFYDNITYNFLPNMLYQAMAKGLGIKEEREELSRQIKERTKQDNEKKKEQEDNRRDIITLGLSIFAVFSIAWDLCSIIKDAYTGNYDHNTAIVILWSAIGVILVLAAYIFVIKKYANK